MKMYLILPIFMIIALVMSACAVVEAPTTGEQATQAEETTEDAGEMTFVGTPRKETLILDNLSGSLERPDFFNIYAPGVDAGRGFHELCTDNLWEIDTTTGQQYGALAAELPTALNDDYTSFEIKLREGIYWDDDVEFTTDDLDYTFQMWMDTEALPIHGWAVDYIDNWEVVDKYTLILNTTRPHPRLAKDLGVTIWDNRLYPLPKHVWENEDPTTFDFFPPVCLGQYSYKDHDPNGNWTVWELRDDWERTSVGQILDSHGPPYIMWNLVGTEE
jgi:peptide/nickel transport system substrate-binding protein